MAIEDLYINDISGASLGVWLEKAPPVVAAKERGEFVEIAGRHGEAWRGDGAYAGYDLECEIYVPETCDLTAVLAWLRGAERVRWGAHPWEVRVSAGETQVELAEWEEYTDCGWLATVTWHAEPFRYVWPHAQAIQCANPQVIVNPCGAAAAPRLRGRRPGHGRGAVGGAGCQALHRPVRGPARMQRQQLQHHRRRPRQLRRRLEQRLPEADAERHPRG